MNEPDIEYVKEKLGQALAERDAALVTISERDVLLKASIEEVRTLTREREAELAKCAEEKKWAEELAADICQMEDALGFKQDQTDKKGAFIPTKVPWLERVRDLIAKEGELGDALAKFAELNAEYGRERKEHAETKVKLAGVECAFVTQQELSEGLQAKHEQMRLALENVLNGGLNEPQIKEALSDSPAPPVVLASELEPIKKLVEEIRDLCQITCLTPERAWVKSTELAREAAERLEQLMKGAITADQMRDSVTKSTHGGGMVSPHP